MSNNPTHVKLYIGKQFHKMLRELSDNYEEWGLDEFQVMGKVGVWRMKLTGAKRGKTFYRWQKVTIPTWSIAEGRDHALYYMLHELAHVVTMGHNHDEEFKRVEDLLLARYGITIVRREKSPYPKTISVNGEVIYERI